MPRRGGLQASPSEPWAAPLLSLKTDLNGAARRVLGRRWSAESWGQGRCVSGDRGFCPASWPQTQGCKGAALPPPDPIGSPAVSCDTVPHWGPSSNEGVLAPAIIRRGGLRPRSHSQEGPQTLDSGRGAVSAARGAKPQGSSGWHSGPWGGPCVPECLSGRAGGRGDPACASPGGAACGSWVAKVAS